MSSPTRYSTSPAPWVPGATLLRSDCLTALRAMPSDSISSICTDPPYGLSDVSSAEVVQAITAWAQGDRERVPDGRGFMGNSWDRFVPPPAVWDECMRVLKPGGHMAVFGGARMADLMGLSIRLAGFEIRDTIQWIYSTGFPKSLSVSKAIDGHIQSGRSDSMSLAEVNQTRPGEAVFRQTSLNGHAGFVNSTDSGSREKRSTPATEAAKKWDGWGTALKPASEPIIMARKPFPGTVAANVLAHGTGGLNIAACRTDTEPRSTGTVSPHAESGVNATYGQDHRTDRQQRYDANKPSGRWPANVVLSHSEWCDEEGGCAEGCPIAELDAQSGATPSNTRNNKGTGMGYHGADGERGMWSGGDSGGASRFFNTFRYQAKAPKSERPVVNGVAHPTVKPLALMEWLVTLLTPPHGVVLDPFTGSGTTGHAALRLGFNSTIIERDAKYWPLIDKRFGDYLKSLKAKVG